MIVHELRLICLTMRPSSNGYIFHITGPLWGESSGHRWIPLTKASGAVNVYFDLHPNKGLSKQSRRRRFETPSRSLWRHCNGVILLMF